MGGNAQRNQAVGNIYRLPTSPPQSPGPYLPGPGRLGAFRRLKKMHTKPSGVPQFPTHTSCRGPAGGQGGEAACQVVPKMLGLKGEGSPQCQPDSCPPGGERGAQE